ncbi:MAG: hypothetical protein RLZZ450_6164 [Pseudomonadota bacterium]
MTRLERLTAIALFLSARLRDLAREIAEKFAVRPRTVYRDMRALSAAGFPVEGNAGDGYRVPQTSYLRPLALTEEESEALTLAAHAFGAVAGPELADALTRATLKLHTRRRCPGRSRRVQRASRANVRACTADHGVDRGAASQSPTTCSTSEEWVPDSGAST